MVNKRLCIVLFAVLITSAMAVSAADWPQFRGPDRDGTSSETGLLRQWPEGGPEVLWSTEVAQGYSAAAIHSGRVYFNDYDEPTFEFLVRCSDPRRRQGAVAFQANQRRIRPNHGITRSVPATDGKYVFALDPQGHAARARRRDRQGDLAQELRQGVRQQDPALVQRAEPADRRRPDRGRRDRPARRR